MGYEMSQKQRKKLKDIFDCFIPRHSWVSELVL